MLVAIDCGNTNTVFGFYEHDELIADARFTSNELGTSAECARALDWFLKRSGRDRDSIEAIVIGSVVPGLTPRLVEMANAYYDKEPLLVSGESQLGIVNLYHNPREVGTDRVVGALAAYNSHRRACIIIDFGTATTIDVVTKKGEYLGGVICPGVQTSALSLSRRAAQLFNVDLKPPQSFVGHTTEESIKSGLLYGTVAMIEGLLARIAEEQKTSFFVVATGGLAPMIAENTDMIDEVSPSLVLDGLALAYKILMK